MEAESTDILNLETQQTQKPSGDINKKGRKHKPKSHSLDWLLRGARKRKLFRTAPSTPQLAHADLEGETGSIREVVVAVQEHDEAQEESGFVLGPVPTEFYTSLVGPLGEEQEEEAAAAASIDAVASQKQHRKQPMVRIDSALAASSFPPTNEDEREESRWESFVQALRPIFSPPLKSPTLLTADRGSALLGFHPGASPVSNTCGEVEEEELHRHQMASVPSTPRHSLSRKRLMRRATIDSSLFRFRRPTAGTCMMQRPTLQELRIQAPPESESHSTSTTSTTNSTGLKATLRSSLFNNGVVRRRSSLHLPLTQHDKLQQSNPTLTSSRHMLKDRWRETVERLRHFTLPSSLFNKQRHMTTVQQQQKEMQEHVQHLFPLMRTAMTVPFYAFLRDEYGQKGVPVILEAIQVRIVEAPVIDEKEQSAQSDKHRVFHVQLSYGDLKWTVKRTLVDFLKLHSILSFRHLQGRLPSLPSFPSQWNYAIHKAMAYAVPWTPMAASGDFFSKEFRRARASYQRRKALEDYFRKVLGLCTMRITSELCTFLELSTASITGPDVGGYKGKEGYLKKRSGDKHVRLIKFIAYHTWNWKWLIVRDSYVAYFDTLDERNPSEVFLFDGRTQVDVLNGLFTGHPLQHILRLRNGSRELRLRLESERQMLEWKDAIVDAVGSSIWTSQHRFGSFAPQRTHSHANYFVDGEDYFEAVAQALESARDTIYIQGWWLSPEIFLKRPAGLNPEYRLDRLLKRKAEEGVLIYVIIYKELSFSLSINSQYTKTVLEGLHPNIRVRRFPDHAPGGVLYWALHDKIVIVDLNVAFLGGLDLCMGRYDTSDHFVGDGTGKTEVWPGIDYSNPRIKDFDNVEKYHQDLVDKSVTARMPWHDIHCVVRGLPARDLARHFAQRWNFIKDSKTRDRIDTSYLLPPPELTQLQLAEKGLRGSCNVQLLRSVSQWSMGVEKECSIYDAYLYYIQHAEHYIYIENQFFISTTVEDDPDGVGVRNHIARALCDRIIRAHLNNQTFRVYVVLPLLPAFESEFAQTAAATIRIIVHWHQMGIAKGDTSMYHYLSSAGIVPSDYITFCSLRTHGYLDQGPFDDPTLQQEPQESSLVTEMVYVHSKMMIVDDRVAIIGSANINDRSMLGSRDSEIAAVIEDDHQVDSVMNGKPYKASKFALELRLRLFSEHLGVDNLSLLMDPVSDSFYLRLWQRTSSTNTAIYREIFRSVPDDTISDWEDYRRFVSTPFRPLHGHVATKAPSELISNALSRVRGNLVLYPIHFVNRENLSMVFPAKEFMVPLNVFR